MNVFMRDLPHIFTFFSQLKQKKYYCLWACFSNVIIL